MDTAASSEREEEEEVGVDNLASGGLGKRTSDLAKGKASVGSVQVSYNQKGNNVLSFIRNVRWEYVKGVKADFVLGQSCCALYLSLRFHRLHPVYIHERIKDVGKRYALRVLLVKVDVAEPENMLRQLNTTCFGEGWTLMLGWSDEEMAELVEQYKIYENKPAEFLMAKVDLDDPRSRALAFLTSIKPLNSSDAEALLQMFGSLKAIAKASTDELSLCPGLGPTKVTRLLESLNRPFAQSSTLVSVASNVKEESVDKT